MNKIIKISFLSLIVGIGAISCSRDFVETEFHQSIEQRPLESVAEMNSFVNGAYASMRSATYYGCDFLAYGEVRSDEMISNLAAGYYTTVMNYAMTSNDPYANNTYNQIYTMIAKVNTVINTDVNKIQGTDLDRQDAYYAQGQAYGLRAIGFFDLFRLYGQKYTGGTLGIVLPLEYDPKALMPRATIEQTEAQIESDFEKALDMMTTYNRGGGKTELTLNALKGMMSRYYLYKGDYAKVRTLTNDLHGRYSIASPELLQVTFGFTMNGAAPNSIFELAVGINSSLSTSSYRYKLSANGYGNLVVNASTYAKYADNDVRKALITPYNGSYYLSFNANGKYTQQVGADNIKMLRYEEIILNGVEAELNGGSPTKALAYYKELLGNRLLPITDDDGNVVSSVQDQLNAITSVDMDMLKEERMKELLGEGLRQWDLRRWGDPVPRPAIANPDPNLNAFPIPRHETDIAGTPVVSNPGYDN